MPDSSSQRGVAANARAISSRFAGSQVPASSKLSRLRIASSTVGPISDRGALVDAREVAANGPGVVVAPTMRSSHPVRTDDPGAARSISSMSVKCDRVGFGWPTACTMASRPEVNSGSSGARAGCRANLVSSASPRACGTAMLGRAV